MDKILNLPILYRVFAVLYFVMGLLMLFGGKMLSDMNGWEHSIGIVTMAEHHGSSLICVSLLFWMLPSWLSIEALKKATLTAMIVQVLLIIMPIYHAFIGAIPNDPSLYFMLAIFIVLIILFYMASNKNEVE